MARRTIAIVGFASAFAALTGNVAKADLAISSKSTENISCSSGVCTATAKKAVLNVDELAAMLASSDTTISTGGIAKDIDVSAPLSWATTSRLTLAADKSLIVRQPVTVTGSGALTISTNGGHQTVDLEFFGKGNVQFWDLSSSLVINGKSYTLVGDIATLAADIAADPSGSFALAKSYDASADGTYSASAVPLKFDGTTEGLGNKISNFTMRFRSGAVSTFGFFQDVDVNGTIRHLAITHADIGGAGLSALVGVLAGGNEGVIEGCSATGNIEKRDSAGSLGGLVGANGGMVFGSFADVKVVGRATNYIGGLISYNAGTVSQSYSAGAIKAASGSSSAGGGLVGFNEAQDGRILNSYSISSVHDGKNDCCYYGGLVGKNEDGTIIHATYAAGEIGGNASSQSLLGGLLGYDGSSGSVDSSYWDLDRGISDPAQGAGNVPNDRGITGLTTQQLQSALPAGFDSKIWAEDPNNNDGLPYLRIVPPP